MIHPPPTFNSQSTLVSGLSKTKSSGFSTINSISTARMEENKDQHLFNTMVRRQD